MNKEIRLLEVKAATLSEDIDNASDMVVEGYAIIFNEETLIGTERYGFKEIISEDALSDCHMDDVILKYNHQDNFLVVARTRNGSLELLPDELGLKIRANLIDTQSNKDLYKMVKERLLDKMSFAFTVKEQSWDRTGEIPVRTILKLDRLYDVSIVDMPAYDGTSLHARSLKLLDDENEKLSLQQQEIKVKTLRTKIKIKGEVS